MTTSAPAWPRAIATALPMPELAPVTSAFWPLSNPGIGLMVDSKFGVIVSCVSKLVSFLDEFQGSARVKQFGYETGPARLVRGPEAAASLTVKVLVKKRVIAKMRIVLQLLIVSEDWTTARRVDEKQACQPVPELDGHVIYGHKAS